MPKSRRLKSSSEATGCTFSGWTSGLKNHRIPEMVGLPTPQLDDTITLRSSTTSEPQEIFPDLCASPGIAPTCPPPNDTPTTDRFKMETIQILQSMYPLPDELILSPDLALALEDPTLTRPSKVGEMSLVLRVPLSDDSGLDEQGRTGEDRVGFKIFFPTRPSGPVKSGSACVKITYAELPEGLIRADVDVLEKELEVAQNDFRREAGFVVGRAGDGDEEDAGNGIGIGNGNGRDDKEEEDEMGLITYVIESVRPRILEVLLHRRAESTTTENPNTKDPASQPDPDEPLERYYLWFPSLSTPSKRKDLVTYASRYDLTGFVLAGKPGLLCLEGRAGGVQAYLGDIKNESWGDIPSYQKKASRGEVAGGAYPGVDVDCS